MLLVIVLPAHRPPTPPAPTLEEYDSLKQRLLLTTLGLVAIIAIPTAIVYDPQTALSFAVGGIGGLVYLRMLARSVESLGTNNRPLGKARLGIFIGLMIIAARWQGLQMLPTFLGFLSYKLAILAQMLQDIVKE